MKIWLAYCKKLINIHIKLYHIKSNIHFQKSNLINICYKKKIYYRKQTLYGKKYHHNSWKCVLNNKKTTLVFNLCIKLIHGTKIKSFYWTYSFGHESKLCGPLRESASAERSFSKLKIINKSFRELNVTRCGVRWVRDITAGIRRLRVHCRQKFRYNIVFKFQATALRLSTCASNIFLRDCFVFS